METGRLFEERLLGRCTVREVRYRPWMAAALEAARHQPLRRRPFLAQLEQELREEVGAPVGCFTAVGSAFDVYHGVDAFVMVRGLKRPVTIDVTRNPHKDCGKADLLLHEWEIEEMGSVAGLIGPLMRAKL